MVFVAAKIYRLNNFVSKQILFSRLGSLFLGRDFRLGSSITSKSFFLRATTTHLVLYRIATTTHTNPKYGHAMK
jgi:hypothetical protein